MGRLDQVNELLRQYLAEAINQEIGIENGMITVSYVSCSKDLRNATVSVSVLPDNLAGTALEKLRSRSGEIARTISKKVKLKNIPRFRWIFDPTEKNAAELEKIFDEIEEEKD